MKRLIATSTVIASLLAGSAAFAEGGYVDEQGFINADAPALTQAAALNDNATTRVETKVDRNGPREVLVTVFAADARAASEGQSGR
ncbi:MAG: hypothetical protein R3D85_02540 [Paracoccaceae bacterium]